MGGVILRGGSPYPYHMRILILTSDKTSWALRPCMWLFEKYWPTHPPVVVAGFSEENIPANCEFIHVGDFADYPFDRWSDALIRTLEIFKDETFIWTMDDFWPIRRVDAQAIEMLGNYLDYHPEIARIDLTADRVLAHGAINAGSLGRLNLVTNYHPVPYHLSLQTGLWRRSALYAYLIPNETPWQVELEGTTRMLNAAANVLGTREEPIKYVIAVQQGKLTMDGGYQGPEHALSQEDQMELREKGWIPDETRRDGYIQSHP